MYRFIVKLWCMAALVAGVVSCSKDEGDSLMADEKDTIWETDKDNHSETNKENNTSTDKDNNSSTDTPNLQQFAGKYVGVWWLNDVKTEADSFFYLWYEKCSQKPDSYIDKHESYPSYLSFYVDQNRNDQHINLRAFPLKALTKQLFPDIELAYLTIDIGIGSPLDSEEKLLLNIIGKGPNSGYINNAIAYSLKTVGYSESALYYNLQPITDTVDLLIPCVVTTKDGNYFTMVPELVPDKSTFSLDITTGTISCNFVISQVEVYDKDMQKSIKKLDQEIKVTFISTQRLK